MKEFGATNNKSVFKERVLNILPSFNTIYINNVSQKEDVKSYFKVSKKNFENVSSSMYISQKTLSFRNSENLRNILLSTYIHKPIFYLMMYDLRGHWRSHKVVYLSKNQLFLRFHIHLPFQSIVPSNKTVFVFLNLIL